jgi:hypothetical protein
MGFTVLDDALFDGMASSILPVDEASSLPPACYIDPAFFEFERDALFRREWLCAGLESQIRQPGATLTVAHAGDSIILVRHRDGRIWGQTSDRANVRVETWHGFIFVNRDIAAPALAPRLQAAGQAVANFDLANADAPPAEHLPGLSWNWKVMLENNNDGYHASRLHKGPLHDFVPSELSVFPSLADGEAGYLRYNGTLHPDASFNPTQRALLPVFPKLTSEERGRMAFVNIPPTLSLVLTSDLAIYVIIHAESAGTHSATIGFLAAPGAMADPEFDAQLATNVATAMEITAQDFHVDAAVQTGLASRYAPRGRYSWQEQAQRDLNVWLVERYRAEWARRKTKPANTPSFSDILVE